MMAANYWPYAGIGSRQTPPDVCAWMTWAAGCLERMGYTLRSGAAPGADAAFEAGVSTGRKEIYLPWRGFEKSRSPFTEPSAAAHVLAAETHPNWDRVSVGARPLHARNGHQVLGVDLKHPALFVLCWTPDGAEAPEEVGRETGGTGQALRLAFKYNVPVCNVARRDTYLRVTRALEEGCK